MDKCTNVYYVIIKLKPQNKKEATLKGVISTDGKMDETEVKEMCCEQFREQFGEQWDTIPKEIRIKECSLDFMMMEN